MENNRMLGEFISQRRKALGLTQKELAAKVGVSDKAVSKWETLEANPDISLLFPLSEALKVSVEELLKGELSQERNEQPAAEQAQSETESSPYKPNSAFQYAIYLIASVLVGIVVVLLMTFVGLAFTQPEEDKIALVVFFTVLLLAFSALFFFTVKKTVQNAFARSELPTDRKEINGYVIYRNLSKAEKRAVNAGLFGKKAKYGFFAVYLVCGLGAATCSVLRFFYNSVAVAICGLVIYAVWMIVQILYIIMKTNRLRKNKIITTRRQFEQLKKNQNL